MAVNASQPAPYMGIQPVLYGAPPAPAPTAPAPSCCGKCARQAQATAPAAYVPVTAGQPVLKTAEAQATAAPTRTPQQALALVRSYWWVILLLVLLALAASRRKG